MPRRDPTERFWSFVEKCPGCWLWTGGTAGKMHHGVFGVRDPEGKMRTTYAHRFSWEIHKGPIPSGMWVLHRCDVPRCVRPDHLFLGTQQDNMDDMIRKGRKAILTFEQRSEVLQRPEVKQKRSKTISKLRWITDGIKDLRINKNLPVPEGWHYGRTCKSHLG